MPKRLFDTDTERLVCDYYWTRLPSGFYPSALEVGAHFGCTNVHVLSLLRKHDYAVRTNAETREHRPCKPINQPPDAPPLCACGCGQTVRWISKEQKWRKFAAGHYRTPKPYKDAAWLRHRYVDELATMQEIAVQCAVTTGTIAKFMRKHAIPVRSHADTLSQRGSVRGDKNPAWKGGVADWDYSYDWKRLCKAIKDRDHWTCQLCGERRKYWGQDLHVHHIDGDKLNNHPHNLIALCSTCHHPIHGDKAIATKLHALAIRNTVTD